MNREQWLGDELGRLESAFAAGRDSAFHEAVALCMLNEVPLPDWMAGRMALAMARDFHGDMLLGRGNASPAKAAETDVSDRMVYDMVDMAMKGGNDRGEPLNQRQSFEYVAEILTDAGKDGKVHTGAMVKAIYWKVRSAIEQGKSSRYFD